MSEAEELKLLMQAQEKAELDALLRSQNRQTGANVSTAISGAVGESLGGGGKVIANSIGKGTTAALNAVDSTKAFLSDPTNGRTINEVMAPVAGGVAGAVVGGPVGAMVGAMAGGFSGSMASEATDPSPNMDTAFARAYDNSIASGIGEGVGVGLNKTGGFLAKKVLGGTTDATGQLIASAADKAGTGAPSRMLTSNRVYQEVDRWLSGGLGTGDAKASKDTAAQLVNELKEQLLTNPKSAAQVGKGLQDSIKAADELTFKYSQAKRSALIQEADATGQQVNFRSLDKKIMNVIDESRRKDPVGVADRLEREFMAKMGGNDRSKIVGMSFLGADGLRQAFSAISQKEGLGSAQEIAKLIDDEIEKSAGTKIASKFANQRKVNQRAAQFFSEGAVASLAAESPERAADVMVEVAGQPNLMRRLRMAIKKSGEGGEKQFQKVQQFSSDSLIANSAKSAAEDTPTRVDKAANIFTGGQTGNLAETEREVSGKKLLSSLIKLDKGSSRKTSEELLGREASQTMYKYAQALERVQKSPGNAGLLALRSIQTVAGARIGMGAFNGELGQDDVSALGVVMLPGAFARAISRNPNIQRILIEGLGEGAKRSPLIKTTLISQMARELYDNDALEAIRIGDKDYPIDSPEAQQVLRSVAPSVRIAK